MRTTLLFLAQATARMGACGYCSWHMTHFKYMGGLEATVWFLFFIYQLLKLWYFLKADNFSTHMEHTLKWLNLAFFGLVVFSCGLEVIGVIFNSTNSAEVIATTIIMFFMKIIVYVIIELIGESIYAIKVNSVQNNDKDESKLFKQAFSNLFNWWGLFISKVEQSTVELEVEKTEPSPPQKRQKEKVELRPSIPSIAISDKEKVEQYLRKRKNRGKNSGKK